MTGTATVEIAITTKTATATIVSPSDRSACEITSAPTMIIMRFFGFTTERITPSPSALSGVSVSIACRYFGSAAVSPSFGRFRHCRCAAETSNRPSTSLIVDTESSGCPLLCERSCVLATISRTIVPPSTPTIQPSRNVELLARARFENSIRITAMIGIGLIAMPSASGSRSPIA